MIRNHTGNAKLCKTIRIEREKLFLGDSFRFDGFGCISANNSSRLLLDYKAEHPEAYRELLEYTFGDRGMRLSLIKIEMGSDVDSSSGTEPAVMRSADERADVTRGAGYQLAADALSIRPDLEVDLLYWGIPRWVADADDSYAAMYKWYRATVEGLFDTYGIKVTYLTANQNERAYDIDFIKYLRNALNHEKDARYDYSQIKLVAGEEVGTWSLADKMLEDAGLRCAVDVISAHYTSWTTDAVKLLQSKYGKKVWFSEGAAPMNVETLAYRYDGTGTGMSEINGMLDIATRITTAMSEGMTMYEFQPAISAYYDGVTYYPKQLITANEPWSGAYSLNAGFYMAMHFTGFIGRGWHMVDGACYGDGRAGGDGHAVVGSTYNYATFADDSTDHATVVLVNGCAEPISYTIDVSTLGCAGAEFHIWQTKGPDCPDDDYYSSFFREIGSVTPDGGRFVVEAQPYSLVTVSTETPPDIVYKGRAGKGLALPYQDDFSYRDYAQDYLESRGYAPRYTTDQGGAFDVVKTPDGNVLMQKITAANKPVEWWFTSEPTTNLGDDTWANYTVTLDTHLEEGITDKSNYAGIGARYNLADSDYSGYWLKVTVGGNAFLFKDSSELAKMELTAFDPAVWHRLRLTVNENQITGFVDERKVVEYCDTENVAFSGRVAIYSGYFRNSFGNLRIEEIDGRPERVRRMDCFDRVILYSEGSNADDGNGWFFQTMSSYRNFHRTVSTASVGSWFSFAFEGTAFALIGPAQKAVIGVTVDGLPAATRETVNGDSRKASYVRYGLACGMHEVRVDIYGGVFALDVVEVY